jgi:FAD-NAD(P)-binding
MSIKSPGRSLGLPATPHNLSLVRRREKPIITAPDAAQLVSSHSTITTGGFGSCGHPNLLTKALADRFAVEGSPGNLTLVFASGQGDRKGRGGYAYQKDLECNLLNTRSDSMSALSDDRQHFRKWLVDKGVAHIADYPDTNIDADDFLPRGLFGCYLSDVYNDAILKCIESRDCLQSYP